MSVLDENRKEFKPRRITPNFSKITKSQLKNAAMLIIKTDNRRYLYQEALEAIRDRFPKNCIIWLCKEGEGVETLSEKEMNKLGWFKRKASKELYFERL